MDKHFTHKDDAYPLREWKTTPEIDYRDPIYTIINLKV